MLSETWRDVNKTLYKNTYSKSLQNYTSHKTSARVFLGAPCSNIRFTTIFSRWHHVLKPLVSVVLCLELLLPETGDTQTATQEGRALTINQFVPLMANKQSARRHEVIKDGERFTEKTQWLTKEQLLIILQFVWVFAVFKTQALLVFVFSRRHSTTSVQPNANQLGLPLSPNTSPSSLLKQNQVQLECRILQWHLNKSHNRLVQQSSLINFQIMS